MITFREKMEIKYLVYFLFKEKNYKPFVPPKIFSIVMAITVICFLLMKAQEFNSIKEFIGITTFSVFAWYLVVLGNLLPTSNATMKKAENCLKSRYLIWQEKHGSGKIKDWIDSLQKEAEEGKFHF